MRILSACVLVAALTALPPPIPLQAAWETFRIDRGESLSSMMLKGDLAAYRKDGDLYLYRFSTDRWTRVTEDSYARTNRIIGLTTETLWYWSHDPSASVYDLRRYYAHTDRNMRIFSFVAGISANEGTADLGRLVILKNHDWCLFRNNVLEGLTFSGEALAKRDAWLTGDFLVWRAVDGVRGVYVTRLPTKQTSCVFQDSASPASLWVSGPHAAWVSPAAGGGYEVIHYRIDTGAIRTVGTSQDSLPSQLAVDSPYLVWLKGAGPSWRLMGTNLEDGAETCLYAVDLPMSTPRVSGDHVLFITTNCPGQWEECSELNVIDRKTGRVAHLTHFGRNSFISSPRIESGRIAFLRRSTASPFLQEAYVGIETREPPGWSLAQAGDSHAALNLALALLPLAIPPWLRRRLIRRGRGHAAP